jgi:hypothetical protein
MSSAVKELICGWINCAILRSKDIRDSRSATTASSDESCGAAAAEGAGAFWAVAQPDKAMPAAPSAVQAELESTNLVNPDRILDPDYDPSALHGGLI